MKGVGVRLELYKEAPIETGKLGRFPFFFFFPSSHIFKKIFKMSSRSVLKFLLLLIAPIRISSLSYSLGQMASVNNGYLISSAEVRGSHFATSFDVFLGPFCEDSKVALPVIKQLAAAYDAEDLGAFFQPRIHLFPLPYNHLSFLPAQACVATGLLIGTGQVVPCLDVVFANQTALKTFALESGTVPSVTEALVQQLTAAFPDLSADALREEMAQGLESGEASYDLTKSDWKYGTSRAVFATPSYFINQVALYGEGEHPEGQLAAFTVDEWREILDPIVNASRHSTV